MTSPGSAPGEIETEAEAEPAAGLAARIPRRAHPIRVPQPVDNEPGLFIVDGTWGQIAPMQLAPGVRTIGELELIGHLERGGPLIDTRTASSYAQGTIPGARSLPWREIADRSGELPTALTAFFCNGPLCAATPGAIELLLKSGRPPETILFYRGGTRDWITCGLPVRPGAPAAPHAAPVATARPAGPNVG